MVLMDARQFNSLQVFDNSADAGADGEIPDPRLLLDYAPGVVRFPDADDDQALADTPEWARPIIQAAWLTQAVPAP
jgi:hypothetical protein